MPLFLSSLNTKQMWPLEEMRGDGERKQEERQKGKEGRRKDGKKEGKEDGAESQ